MKATFFILLALVLIAAIVLGPRLRKDVKKKQQYQNTFAIQNVGTGLCLRPLDAHYEEGVPLVLYPLHNWECITWQIIRLEGNACLMKNLYTQRTFMPDGVPNEGVSMRQAVMGGDTSQLWVMEADGEGTYRIHLRDNDLYLTAPSSETNARPVLRKQSGDDSQLWRLVSQNPIV